VWGRFPLWKGGGFVGRQFVGLFLASWLAWGVAGAADPVQVRVEIRGPGRVVTGFAEAPLPAAGATPRSVLFQLRDATGTVTAETVIVVPGIVDPPVDPPPEPPVDPPEQPPEPVDVVPPPGTVPEWLETRADRLRVQGATYTDAVARSGPWHDPATWIDGSVPTETDAVFVQPGAVVNNDGEAVADTIVVGGVLSITPTKSTRITVTTLTVLEGGQFLGGDDDSPVTGQAEIVLRDTPIDLTADPGAYGHGIIVFGTFSTCGEKKTPFLRVAAEPKAGDSVVMLEREPSNWDVGDQVVLPDTRQLSPEERGLKFAPQWERHTMGPCDCPPGTPKDRIDLARPLQFSHLGARDLTGTLDTFPHVANLTRSWVIRSENPAGVAGHVQFHHRAVVSIKYTAFVGLGRTTIDKLGPTNQIGRYAGPHFHHVLGAVPTGAVTGPQYVMEGCVVDGTEAVHRKKWGIVLHGSHYGHVFSNVVYNTNGAGIILEDATETGTLVEDNFVLRVRGWGGRVDTSHGTATQGSGIYLRGPMSPVRGNVVADCPDNYGFVLNFSFLGKTMVATGPGIDPHEPGKGKEVNANAVGVAGFSDNEAYACESGATIWWAGTTGTTPIAGARETLIENFFSWNHWLYGFWQYQTHNMVVDGLKTRGTVDAKNVGALGYFGSDYTASNLVIRNADIQGQKTGISASVRGGPQLFENCRFAATVGISTGPPWTSAAGAEGLPPRVITVRDCLFSGPTANLPFTAIGRYFPPSVTAKSYNLVTVDQLRVENYQRVAGDSFRLFYAEQAPGFIVPVTIPNVKYGGSRMVGSPTAGLSNAELWAQHGLAIAGEVAPCSTTRAGLLGLVCE
jgi:G8 domain